MRDALFETFQDWKEDLSDPWKKVFEHFEHTDLDYDSVDPNLEHFAWEPIFPSRKNNKILGEPRGASTLAAFSGISPNKVKAVLIGQDPYPDISRATGRAFEQGDIDNFQEDSYRVTKSLRSILQVLADYRMSTDRYTQIDGYEQLVNDIENKKIVLETRSKLFQKWVNEGVLLLNAGLTISRFGGKDSAYQHEGHIPFWEPVISRTLQYLSERQNGHIVFILWGTKAQGIFKKSDVEATARKNDYWGTRIMKVVKNHPAYIPRGSSIPEFFMGKNALLEVNEALDTMNTKSIDW